MPNYRRAFSPGGTFVFTLVTANRQPLFHHAPARSFLHDAFSDCRRGRPMEIVAICLLPDHLHAILQLPPGDADFSSRCSHLKSAFTRRWLAAGGTEPSISIAQQNHRRRGIAQRHFWEHCLRHDNDLHRHFVYIHFNPVKHGHAACPHAWPYSSSPRLTNHGTTERPRPQLPARSARSEQSARVDDPPSWQRSALLESL